MSARSGKDSRCCKPVSIQRRWISRVDRDRPAAQEYEEWLSSLSPFARRHEEGEQDDLFEAAAYGELEDTGDQRTPIKPIVKDPEMYELRRTALRKKLRFYHGEPPSLPDVLLRVHRHIKVDGKSQEVEIRFAACRYDLLTGERAD
ncbi:hypothetical protein ACXR2T_09040 [Leucobacter sp. HY1910]